MRPENIIAAYRHIPFLPKRAMYRHLVNWIEAIRAGSHHKKMALINLGQNKSFNINIDINTWLGKEIFYFGKFELYTYRFFLANVKPGSVCIDVGANIGFYSLLFSEMSGENGKIHCFEPTQKFFSKLEENLKLNNPDNMVLTNKALGDRLQKVSMKVGDQTAFVSDNDEGETVQQITLDQYLDNIETSVDLIKIDVDGHELPILTGAINTIEKYKPLICIEVSRHQDDSSTIFNFLVNAGYRVFQENNSSHPLNLQEFHAQFETSDGFNLIAIPHDCEFQLW